MAPRPVLRAITAAAAPGGDLGGARTAANEHIIAAVQEPIAVIKATPAGRGRGAAGR
jgi:hypothetical protein